VTAIRTPDHRVRVFVSSTLAELAPEREAVRHAVEQLRLIPVMFELGARPHPPKALYRAYLEQSDVFVGIYWQSAGWVAPGEDVSGLEDEYQLAAGAMPQLVYIKEPAPERTADLVDLLHRIQDDDRLAYRRFSTIEELAGLVAEDLAVLLSERFAALAEPAMPQATALPPAPLDRTFGRDADVSAVVQLVHDGHRLVTLTGPGGIGKSRLAIEAARALRHDMDCTVFVPLASITDAATVTNVIAQRMGVWLGGAGDARTEIVAELSRKQTLLAIDNFEHLMDAAPQLASILEGTDRTTALVTSRHALRVQGEREYLVGPLNESPAMALFADRAASARPGFALDAGNREAVNAITQQLDGMPLAIELAAPLMRFMSPESLAAQLADRMGELLQRGPADAPDRQRTLWATMDWSYQLLAPAEQVLFARLAMFEGSFQLEGAEVVCREKGDPSVVDTLAGLLEKSLVVPAELPSTEPRLRMLEPVRAYACEKFQDLADGDAVMQRHARWVLTLLTDPARRPRPPHHSRWVAGFDHERQNLRAAVRRALRRGDPLTVADLVQAAMGYLSLRDAEAEAARWVEEAAGMVDGAASGSLGARLTVMRALLASALGHYEAARQLLTSLGPTASLRPGSMEAGGLALVEAVVASAFTGGQEAVDAAVRAAQAMAAANSDVGEEYMWQTAGTIAMSTDVVAAEGYLQRAIDLADALDNDGLRAQALAMQGFCVRRADPTRMAEARALLTAAAAASLRSGQRSSMAYALDGLAAAALDLDQPDVATRALAASAAARASVDRTAWAAFHPLRAALERGAREALGDAAFDAFAASNPTPDIAQEVQDALDAVQAAAAPARA